MQDTPFEILQKQRELIYKKTAEERFFAGAGLIDFGREIVESGIMKNNRQISKTELWIEVFKRYYAAFFAPCDLEKIIQSMRQYYKNKNL